MMFLAIGALLALVFPKLRKLLVVVLLAMAVGFAFFGLTIAIPGFTAFGFAFGAMTLTGATAALVLGGIAMVMFPDETSEVIEDALKVVGEVAKDVVATVVDVAQSAATSFLSSPLGLALIGFGLYIFLGKKKDDDEATPVSAPSQTEGGFSYESQPAS